VEPGGIVRFPVVDIRITFLSSGHHCAAPLDRTLEFVK
jgi:hypothetical protein